MPFPYDEFDLSGVRTYPLAGRASKARAEDFGRPFAPGGDASPTWFASLPAMLGARDLQAAAAAIAAAKRGGRGVVWGIGAHVIKTGVSPILIDLMERGFVSALAMNGAGIIHDFEIALSGATSEDVDEALGPGRFGMAAETAQLNDVIRRGAEAGQGIGQAVGAHLAALDPPFARHSLAATAHRLGIPLTVHVALGTDIIHMHPAASGAATRRGQPARLPLLHVVRRAPRRRRLSELRLRGGAARGVPEGRRARPQPGRRPRRSDHREHRLHAALPAADQRRHAARRRDGGTGISLVGHHEILIPLLAAAVIETAGGSRSGRTGRTGGTGRSTYLTHPAYLTHLSCR